MNRVTINGISYIADLAKARVVENGRAKLTLSGSTLPYGTKLYIKGEPVISDLPDLLRALLARGAERDLLKAVTLTALFGLDGLIENALDDSVCPDNVGGNGADLGSSGPDSAE